VGLQAVQSADSRGMIELQVEQLATRAKLVEVQAEQIAVLEELVARDGGLGGEGCSAG
jgi:hypothetical protein